MGFARHHIRSSLIQSKSSSARNVDTCSHSTYLSSTTTTIITAPTKSQSRMYRPPGRRRRLPSTPPPAQQQQSAASRPHNRLLLFHRCLSDELLRWRIWRLTAAHGHGQHLRRIGRPAAKPSPIRWHRGGCHTTFVQSVLCADQEVERAADSDTLPGCRTVRRRSGNKLCAGATRRHRWRPAARDRVPNMAMAEFAARRRSETFAVVSDRVGPGVRVLQPEPLESGAIHR